MMKQGFYSKRECAKRVAEDKTGSEVLEPCSFE